MPDRETKLTVRHAIGGGWATDFGPVAEIGPEVGTVEIYGLQIDIGRKKGRPKLPPANRS